MKQQIRFLFPVDGDCINQNDGPLQNNGIRITARVEAPSDHEVKICGAAAIFDGNCFSADITLCHSENTLQAIDITDNCTASVKVYIPKSSLGGFRLSSDDNIIFLSDITEHQNIYQSVFDNPYLAIYKKAHDLYGVKVHLNLFYEFDNEARTRFSSNRNYFNLSMMTNRFRDEFRQNSDWLKFSFHAHSEFPDKPYKFTESETVKTDAEKVNREIIRFAGEECLSSCTTVHWGELTKEGALAMHELGYRFMTGYFIPGDNPVAYYASDELIRHIYNRDFWYDAETDILFGRIDLVLNSNTHTENMAYLKAVTSSPTQGGFLSVMIHEQYFHEDYQYYLPDFEIRILDACKFLSEQGYQGRHISEISVR